MSSDDERSHGRPSMTSAPGGMVKLLEDISSATEHRPAERRPVVTLAITGAALVVAAVIGVVLLVTGGNGGQTAPPPQSSTVAEVAMPTWVSGVDQACAQVGQTHPILAEGAAARTNPANVATVDLATRDLANAVRGIPLPTATADNERATEAVRLGDQADQAWYGLAALPPAEHTEAKLTEASATVTAFVTRLGELGAASCAAFA
jgi:hypothetical protein